MKSLKALFAAALVTAAALSATGCSAVQQLNAHGQELRAQDPDGYAKMTGEDNYRSTEPSKFVQGS